MVGEFWGMEDNFRCNQLFFDMAMIDQKLYANWGFGYGSGAQRER